MLLFFRRSFLLHTFWYSYDKKTLARQVIPLALGYWKRFRRALIIPVLKMDLNNYRHDIQIFCHSDVL